jgi:hypothetical protein
MFSFTLKRLFVCVTLVAIGGYVAWRQFEQRTDANPACLVYLWLFGGALLGAGIGQLHNRYWPGAAIGGIAGAVIQTLLEQLGVLNGHV